MSFKKICICLILIFCIIGAASAAEDVSADVVDFADDSVAVDAVSDDVSDSLESVDDEAVVDESAPAQDDSDDVDLEASVDDEPALDEVDDELSGQSHILGDDSSIEERYVTNIDELKTAYDEISDNGIIYLSDGSYNWLPRCANSNKNVTFIGQSKNTIFTLLKTVVTSYNNPSPVLTFINLTFNSSKPVNLTMNSNFINCSFNSNILIADGIAKIQHLDEKPFGVTYNLTFDNCEFKDFSMEEAVTSLIKMVFTYMIVNSPTVTLRVLQTFQEILKS